MKLRTLSNTPTRTEAPSREAVGVGTPSLSNHPCNVKLTVQMEGFPAHEITLENENEVRNVIARFIPPTILTTSPAEVLPHLTDDLDDLFNLMVTTGKSMNLSLPAGI